jgi:hypothetical protein
VALFWGMRARLVDLPQELNDLGLIATIQLAYRSDV